MKSEPKHISLQVRLAQGTDYQTQTSVFEVNFDSLSAQKIFIDESKRVYMIVQAVNRGQTKVL